MATAYAQHFSTRQTPQSEPIPGKAMVPNSAGGHAFAIDDFARLNRFLILGAEGGTYYASEKKLTVENAQCVLRCLDSDPARALRTMVEISQGGRAPKNDPAIFALAIAAGHANPEVRAAANAAIPLVCRIPTHLYQFIGAVKGFRGWGAGLRKAIAAWYAAPTPEQLAYHCIKYQQRDGMSHRDVLRLVHPKTDDPARQAVYRWIVGGMDALGPREVRRGKGEKERVSSYAPTCELPAIIAAFEEAKSADEKGVIRLIREAGLPRECVPTQHLNSADVWEALLEKMPLHAMTRNLAKMTAVGLLKPLSSAAKTVADRLGDQEYIRKSRLHPMAILVAAKIYTQGHGDKGSLSWTPVSTINDALDSAFYLSFGNVEATGKRTFLALDVSGSMSSPISGGPISCREGAAALAMVTAKVEPNYFVAGFTANADGSLGGQWGSRSAGGWMFGMNPIGASCDPTLTPIDISKASRLSDVVRITEALPMGGTDCSLPMRWALTNKVDVDTFVVLTDNETWFGNTHPCQALRQYREKTGIPARLVVVAMTATQFSIADPDDGGSLDCIGFDTATPQIISDFSAGKI